MNTKPAYQQVRDDFLAEYTPHIENFVLNLNYANNATFSVEALTADLENMLSLGANRMTNMTGSRHSDSMRSEVNSLRQKGIRKYMDDWEEERS